MSKATEEQRHGVEQIGTAVLEMDRSTQSNAANAEESARASRELESQAGDLARIVLFLKGSVKGSESVPVSPGLDKKAA